MPPRHYTIPIFVPELACPFQCVFCNQKKITGEEEVPAPEEISLTIEKYLKTLPSGDRIIEIGFFGGNFTGIPLEQQEEYLAAASGYQKRGLIDSIRLSTRPDYINEEVIGLLKKYNVGTVELGAQSMDEEVLIKSGRGHTVSDILDAAGMVREAGFRLGLQMMIGLPGDDARKAVRTAREIVKARADETRIYPCLVIRNTKLQEMYETGGYLPLTLDEAVRRTVKVYKVFAEAGVKIIRMGLHPSDGILSGDELVAGPFHPSFRELVMTRIWWEKLKALKPRKDTHHLKVFVAPSHFNFAVGYEATNRKKLLKRFDTVVFQADPELKEESYEYHIH